MIGLNTRERPSSDVSPRRRSFHVRIDLRMSLLALSEMAGVKLMKRDFHQREVAGRHEVAVNLHILAWPRHMALDLQVFPRTFAQTERHIVGVSNGCHARLAFQPLAQVPAKRVSLLHVEIGCGKVELGNRYLIGVKTRMD